MREGEVGGKAGLGRKEVGPVGSVTPQSRGPDSYSKRRLGTGLGLECWAAWDSGWAPPVANPETNFSAAGRHATPLPSERPGGVRSSVSCPFSIS